MTTTLPLEDYLRKAEREYVLDKKNEFQFQVRAKSGEQNFYQQLEAELRVQNQIKVIAYRSVKEGWTKLSRPAILGFNEETLLKHRPHLKLLRQHIESLAQKFSNFSVYDFVRSNYADCSQDASGLAAALDVFQYLIDHKKEIVGLMPRQIPHGQSTKLIGRNNLLLNFFSFWLGYQSTTWKDFYKYFKLLDRPAEFRFFSPSCLCQNAKLENYHGLMALEWIEQFSFPSSKSTLIVENIEAFFYLVPQVKDTLLIWGGGWKAAQLKRLFSFFPGAVFYWGDIDKEGYEIYGYLKKLHPPLTPLLMSKQVIQKHQDIHQKKDVFGGPFQMVEGLQEEYEEVCLRGIQIEQEQLKETWPFQSVEY